MAFYIKKWIRTSAVDAFYAEDINDHSREKHYDIFRGLRVLENR